MVAVAVAVVAAAVVAVAIAFGFDAVETFAVEEFVLEGSSVDFEIPLLGVVVVAWVFVASVVAVAAASFVV